MKTPFKAVALCLTLVLCLSNAVAGPSEDFFAAIRNDNASRLKDLLQQGLDPNTRSEKGQPGLTVAMAEQSPKAAKLLIEQPGIDLNALNSSGESPLMMAALKGDLPDTRLLIERGARVNQPGWAPLHYAATGPSFEVVKLLVERGAEVDALSPNGSTPLMLAAQYGSEDTVKFLLDRGADWKLRNQKNLAAVDFARLAGRDYLVRRFDALQR